MSVEISPFAGGLLRTWTSDGSQLWQVLGADPLDDLLGRGLLPRTQVEPGRWRETALLEQPPTTVPGATGRLLLPARHQDDGAVRSGRGLELPCEPLLVSPVGGEDLGGHDDRLWSSFLDRLTEVCLATVERGEVLLLERGGQEHQPWPYALLAVARSPDGSWVSHVETSPAPTPELRGWDQAARGRNADGTDGASLSAPATFETARMAAFLLTAAATQWAATPLDLAITYASAPSGPVGLLPGMPASPRHLDA